MCDYKGASLRKGIVVNATDPAGDLIRLSVGEARKIGQQIDAARSRFVDAQISSIEQLATDTRYSTVQSVSPEEGAVAPLDARFQPGLILDFPRLLVEDDKFGTLAVRTCITVCALDARSKIWTRCVTERGVDAMSSDDLDRFHALAATLCDNVNEATRVHYQEHFSLERFETAPQLSTHGEINLLLVDCAGDKFQSALSRRFEEISWNDETQSKIDDWEVTKALRGVTGIEGAPIEAQDAQPGDAVFELKPGASFYPFMSSKGAQALFVAYAAGNSAHLYGIVGSAPKESDTKPYPPSVGLSAELANHLGSVY